MDTSDVATFWFQDALPYAFLPVSSELAAMHATRARSHPHPRFTDDRLDRICLKCGTELHLGMSKTRVVRLKNKNQHHPYNVLRKLCTICGRENITPVASQLHYQTAVLEAESTLFDVSIAQIPPVGVAVERASPGTQPASPPIIKKMRIGTTHLAKSAPQGKASTRKQAGLQDLLLRNREKEKDRLDGSKNAKSGGLATFLSGL